VVSLLARLLRLASIVICLIVIASFALFAINQTGSASAHQQQVLNGEANAPRGGTASTSPEHKGSAREAIDDASNALTSPFSGVTGKSSSEWTVHIVRTALALAVYGFALGFLARAIRVRV
jgi:hypothetical protein